MRFLQEHIETELCEGTIFVSQNRNNGTKATIYLSPDQIESVAAALIKSKNEWEAKNDRLPKA